MRRIFCCVASGYFAVQFALVAVPAGAQIAPSAAEQDRQATIARQIALIDQIRFWGGLPDRRVYDQPGASAAGQPPIAARYASSARQWPGPLYGGWFEPWPLVPGDIYGYRFDRPARQPIGNRITPNGRGGYIYRPVYDAEDASSARDDVATTEGTEPAQASEPAQAPADRLWQSAVEQFRAGRYDRSLAALDQMRRATDEPAVADLLAMQCYFAMAQFPAAVDALERALSGLDPSLWGYVIENRSALYPDWHVYVDQLHALELQVERQPTDRGARLLLAYHYGMLGYKKPAIEHLGLAGAGQGPDSAAERLRNWFGGNAIAPARPPQPQPEGPRPGPPAPADEAPREF